MIYKNEKLNITVRNAEFFEIVEQNNHVELFSEQRIKMFTICADSRIEAFGKSSVRTYSGSSVYAFDNSSVEANNNSSVETYDDSSVYAFGNSRVYAYDNSSVEANNNSRVYANNNSSVEAYNNSSVEANNNSRVSAFDKSSVEANNNSSVEAYDNSSVEAYDNSRVSAYNNSMVSAFDKSRVYAFANSTIIAREFSCIYVKNTDVTITKENHFGAIIKQVFILENDIIVYKKLQESKIAALLLKKGQVFQSQNHNKCRTNEAFVMAIESIDRTQTYQDGFSQFDSSFVYKVGEIVKSVYDEDIEECSDGIHFFLTREQAVNY